MNFEEIDTLNKQMNNFFTDYDYTPEEGEIEKLYDYLTKKETFTALQYRFLCWSGNKLGRPIKLNIPHISDPIDYELEAFKEKFLYTPKRENLYNNLAAYVEKLKNQYRMADKLEVLVGGSFTDPDHDNPSDIDAVILLAETHQKNFNLHEIIQKRLNNIPESVDIHFLPVGYDIQRYKAYSNISHLSSKPNDKQKGKEIENNSFELRELIKISM